MARISGIDLPQNKKIKIALTSIYGIGMSKSREVLQKNNISINLKTKDLSEEQVKILRDYIENNIKVEGELRSEVFFNIKRLIDIASYRGIRHKKGLPVHGQRTRTNAKTRKFSKKKY